MAWCHRTMLAYWKFESISLQPRVGCELGYCKGGPAASFRGRHKRVRDSNAAPHSDDVGTGSTAVDADGQSEHVSRGAAASRVGSARTLAGCLSIFGQSARCTAYLRPEDNFASCTPLLRGIAAARRYRHGNRPAIEMGCVEALGEPGLD